MRDIFISCYALLQKMFFFNSFEISVFLQTLAMIHSIEMINNSSLLSGVKLGYEIYDTCTEVTATMALTH